MKTRTFLLTTALVFFSCNHKNGTNPLIGTWQLISGTTITRKDTITIDYKKNQEAIKIINATHFSFMIHDLNKGKTSSPIFVAGAGSYSLKDGKYIEHLEYCNYRDWENTNVGFSYTLKNDTLTLKGTETIDSLKINQEIIEKYIKLK